MLTGLLVALTALALMSGCGPQKDKANKLYREADSILADSATPKVNEIESLFSQAVAGSAKGDKAAVKASLERALQLIDEAVPEIGQAKSKIDEAASLNISENHRRFLEAKDRSLAAMLSIEETRREAANTLLADPALERQETLAKMAELRSAESRYSWELQKAESEAKSVESGGGGGEHFGVWLGRGRCLFVNCGLSGLLDQAGSRHRSGDRNGG